MYEVNPAKKGHAMSKLNENTIAAYEAMGFKRWIKGSMDRLYINVTRLGLEVDYYKTGNVSSATWQGESISNADARRLLGSKVYVDVNTGELNVSTSYRECYDTISVEDAAKAYVAEVEASLAQVSTEVETKRAEITTAFELFSAECLRGAETDEQKAIVMDTCAKVVAMIAVMDYYELTAIDTTSKAAMQALARKGFAA